MIYINKLNNINILYNYLFYSILFGLKVRRFVVKIENFLVKADCICDYIPFLSTTTNLVDLFQKSMILPRYSSEETETSTYFKHLKSKKISRMLALLVPIFGNILVAISDFRKIPGMVQQIEEIKKELEITRKKIEFFKKRHSIRP